MLILFSKHRFNKNFLLDGDGPELPTRCNEEFRPFIRRLPEFKFWYSVMKSTVIAMICTMFDCFNIPVFWPILVMYFITLFCITMKRQIKVRSHILIYDTLLLLFRYRHTSNKLLDINDISALRTAFCRHSIS